MATFNGTSTNELKHAAFLAGTVLMLSACSMGQLVVRGSQPILESGRS